jgi:membrane-bound lytic murein transglycosylase D
MQPIRRILTTPTLAALALVAGCAHQPTTAPTGPVPVAAAGEPGARAGGGMRSSAPHDVRVTSTAVAPAAAGETTPAEPAAADAEASMLQATPVPVPDLSLVAVPGGDVFSRLRGGFRLEDADEVIVDREVNWYANHPDYLERTWGRAEHYLHYIIEQLDARKMPLELALLPVVESAFEPYAYSRARAAGMWQFIPGTAALWGLKTDWWYDGRRDVVASTRAALDYLQSLHDMFGGDWLLAIAAYNCGEGNIQRAVDQNLRLGRPIDFWHLQLPRETLSYVPKLLAMRRIVTDPAAYGLEFSPIPDEPYFRQVATGGQIDLTVVAELAGITKDELYELNPAFHRWATDPVGPYTVLVPVDTADGLEQALASLTPEQRMPVAHYQVRRGDTLAAIASRNDTTAEVLRHLNNMDARDKPEVGSALLVPSAFQLPEKALRAAALVDRPGRIGGRRRGHGGVHVVRRGDTLYSIAHRLGTDVQTLARMNNMDVHDPLKAGQRLVVAGRAMRAPAGGGASASASGGGGRQVTYTVRRGDTLYSIARALQVSVGELLGWNGMSDAAIHPGQKLIAFVSTRD